MSIVNNSQSLSFINESHGFVTGMVVSYAKGLVCDVQLSGSNQRFPNSWKNLPAKITYKDEEILIEFLRPGNYYNIKLEIYGLEKDSITATFIQSKILDRSEVLKRLKEKTITFAAPVRNCGSALRSGIELASKLGEYFKDYKIAIFENDFALRIYSENGDLCLEDEKLIHFKEADIESCCLSISDTNFVILTSSTCILIYHPSGEMFKLINVAAPSERHGAVLVVLLFCVLIIRSFVGIVRMRVELRGARRALLMLRSLH